MALQMRIAHKHRVALRIGESASAAMAWRAA